ncbi:Hypothetical predicted protein [Mytilus galloprovincialis]|uniref:TTF-type domain-containing protein n=1 Tax=Mytilus galloprovincialis TaxID=29158 RepID=A0A8B6DEC7_MYTGA|nr:Hypothetical predicted protein [Mytilus galloprovincialis]
MKKLDFYFSKKAADNESQNVLSNSPSKDVNEPCTSFSQDVTAKKITLFDPPYPDISSLTNDELSKHETKVNLLQQKWEPNSYGNYSFPSRVMKNGVKRKVQNVWFKEHQWLRYSVSEDSLYCAPCVLFGRNDSIKEKTFIRPVTDWTNISGYFKRHERSDSSHFRFVEMADNFLRVIRNEKPSISDTLTSSRDLQIGKNRHIMKRIIETLILCGRQNIAVRGHTEERNEATDTSTKEQVSLCLRFLEHTDNGLEVREEFVGFLHAHSIRGQALATLLLDTIDEYEIDGDKMRAQGYDGEANMSGKHQGVQAHVKERFPEASYVHCKSHCLNLAIVHSCKDASVRTIMSTVQDIAFSFDYSAKKMDAFYNELDADILTKEELDGRRKLRTLCETRWTSRADSLYTFRVAFPVIVSALEHLRQDGDDKAGQFLAAISRFEFIIGLVTTEHILQSIVHLTTYLQSKSCDLVEAVRECKLIIDQLSDERNDDSVWDALFDKAVTMADTIEVLPSMPRRIGRHVNRANHPADTPSQYWKRALYCPFLDYFIAELTGRLLDNSDRFQGQNLIPARLEWLTAECIDKLYETYRHDLTDNQGTFNSEVQRWQRRWSSPDVIEKPKSLKASLSVTNKELYPSIFAIFAILVTMPVTTSTTERSFSSLRRLKTYLRSTMVQDRLSSLALIHVHREMDIDTEEF